MHLTDEQLVRLTDEIREALCGVVSTRSAHFASNLGVVELASPCTSSSISRKDRLIWDTGHQIYPHKLITGRFREFDTIRTKGGLMGYPNPDESAYDLFMTGHAGCERLDRARASRRPTICCARQDGPPRRGGDRRRGAALAASSSRR